MVVLNWRNTFGPLDMPMPNDGEGHPISADGIHEDTEDKLNPDGTWGPPQPYAPGGSGIVMGYSVNDVSNVIIAEEAVHKRPVKYDWEHWIRQIRYAIAAWEMTRQPKYARRINEYWRMAKSSWSETGPVSWDPSWVPQNIHQYHEMAKANPHTGVWMNLRAAGWIAYSCAMSMKVCPTGPAWANMFLDTCELAAMPGTGQVVSADRYFHPELPIQYTFHWGILVHGTLALCHRLNRPIPQWIFDGMEAMYKLTPVDYGGHPSIPSYLYTSGGEFHVANIPEQHGDPAHGWWSTNCATLYWLTGDPIWLTKATKFGPTVSVDEQSRKETMLMRGITNLL